MSEIWPFGKETSGPAGRIQSLAARPEGLIVGSAPPVGHHQIKGLAPQHFRLVFNEVDGLFFIEPQEGLIWLDGKKVDKIICIERRTVWLACGFINDLSGQKSFLLAFNGISGELWRPSVGAKSLHASNVVATTSPVRNARIALDGLSFEVLPGEFISVMGPSGAGKSTLVELLLGCRKPHSGMITIGGDWTPTAFEAREVVSFCPQYLSLPLELSGRELLSELSAQRGVNLQDATQYPRETQLLNFCGFNVTSLDTQIGMLSGGEYRRLSLCTALVRKKLGLLILDEPTTGLDPVLEEKVALSLREISRHGITVFVITHSPKIALYSDRVIILRPPDSNEGPASSNPNRRLPLAFYGRINSPEELFEKLRHATIGNDWDVPHVDSDYARILNARFG